MAVKSAQEMVVLLRQALQQDTGGVVSVTIDGRIVTYNFDKCVERLKFWQKEAAREAGRRPTFVPIRLG